MESGKAREVSVFTLVQEAAKLGGSEGPKLLETFATGADRLHAVKGFATGKMEVDLRAAFSVAAGEPPGPLRKELLEVAARRAGDKGVASTRELLDRIEEPELRRSLAAAALYQVGSNSQDDPLPWIIEETQRGDFRSAWGDEHDPGQAPSGR
jgi:hypothetical protein